MPLTIKYAGNSIQLPMTVDGQHTLKSQDGTITLRVPPSMFPVEMGDMVIVTLGMMKATLAEEPDNPKLILPPKLIGIN